MMCGGFGQHQMDQENKQILANHLGDISTKLSLQNANDINNWHIVKFWSQIVAGKFNFYHLKHGDKDYSACIFVPLPHTNAPTELSYVKPGHIQPSNPNSMDL